jgi:hypothetical protein
MKVVVDDLCVAIEEQQLSLEIIMDYAFVLFLSLPVLVFVVVARLLVAFAMISACSVFVFACF